MVKLLVHMWLILEVSNRTPYPTHPPNPTRKPTNQMLVTIGGRSSPPKLESDWAIGESKHERLIFNQPDRLHTENFLFTADLSGWPVLFVLSVKIQPDLFEIQQKRIDFSKNQPISTKFYGVFHSLKLTDNHPKSKNI